MQWCWALHNDTEHLLIHTVKDKMVLLLGSKCHQYGFIISRNVLNMFLLNQVHSLQWAPLMSVKTYWYLSVWDCKCKSIRWRMYYFLCCRNHAGCSNFWNRFPMYLIWTDRSASMSICPMREVGVEWGSSDPQPLRSRAVCLSSSDRCAPLGPAASCPSTDHCAPCCPGRSWFEPHSCHCSTARGRCWGLPCCHLVACWWGGWRRSRASWLGSRGRQSLTSVSCSEGRGAGGRAWGGCRCLTGRGVGRWWTAWGLRGEGGGPVCFLRGLDTQRCSHLPHRSASHPRWLSTSLPGSFPHPLHLWEEHSETLLECAETLQADQNTVLI